MKVKNNRLWQTGIMDWVGALFGTGLALVFIGLLVCFLEVLFDEFK